MKEKEFDDTKKISIKNITVSGAVNLAYDFPLHPNGTQANISFAKTTYELGDKYKDLDGSQDLSIGGIYGVRYYPDGEEKARTLQDAGLGYTGSYNSLF